MKFMCLSVLSILSATAAFADPSYRCEPSEPNSFPVLVTVSDDGAIEVSDAMADRASTAEIFHEQAMPGTPEGYTRFFARQGCKQQGPGPHCFAMWINTLLVDTNMMNSYVKGDIVLNGSRYACEMEMTEIEGTR